MRQLLRRLQKKDKLRSSNNNIGKRRHSLNTIQHSSSDDPAEFIESAHKLKSNKYLEDHLNRGKKVNVVQVI